MTVTRDDALDATDQLARASAIASIAHVERVAGMFARLDPAVAARLKTKYVAAHSALAGGIHD